MSTQTDAWQKFCDLWRCIGAHREVYGEPPRYRKTASFLAAGGFMSARNRDGGR